MRPMKKKPLQGKPRDGVYLSKEGSYKCAFEIKNGTCGPVRGSRFKARFRAGSQESRFGTRACATGRVVCRGGMAPLDEPQRRVPVISFLPHRFRDLHSSKHDSFH
jgi:hypothetical protein